MHIAQTCFENISLSDFWSLADEYSDQVTRPHRQARTMDSFGLNGSVPSLMDVDGALYCICKKDIKNSCHFFSGLPPV